MSKKGNSLKEKVENYLLDKGKEYLKDEIKKKALWIGEISVLFLIGSFLIAFGIARYLEFKFQAVSNGIGTIIFGGILVLFGYLISNKK